jgi:hypothetical protein
MTIVPILVGGFGNRLYQIANAFRLQNQLKCNVKYYKINPVDSDVSNFRNLVLRKSDFEDFGGHELIIKEGLPSNISEVFPHLNYVHAPTKINDILINKNLFFEHTIDRINPNIDSIVMGYYFGYRFIKNHIEDVRNSLNPNIDRYVNQKYPDLLKKRILGIHLRLGIGSDNNPAIVVPMDFYNKILEIERGNFDEIYIVSDNIEKSKNFIYNFNTEGVSVTLIESEPMYVDMLILSKCSTLSIAPSTLSAWSAYLNNNKNVYVPKIWVTHHWTNDIPQEWKLF